MTNQTTKQQLISEALSDKANTWLENQGYKPEEGVYPSYVKLESVTDKETGEAGFLSRWVFINDDNQLCLETFIDFESNAQEVYRFGRDENKLLLALQQHQPAKPGTQSYNEDFQFLTAV